MDYSEKIPVKMFKGINIQFPGDVYLLAFLVAMSDQAKSTPTHITHTTLSGFANKVASTYGIEFPEFRNSDGVMSIFRKHGIEGNPMLTIEEKDKQLLTNLFRE